MSHPNPEAIRFRVLIDCTTPGGKIKAIRTIEHLPVAFSAHDNKISKSTNRQYALDKYVKYIIARYDRGDLILADCLLDSSWPCAGCPELATTFVHHALVVQRCEPYKENEKPEKFEREIINFAAPVCSSNELCIQSGVERTQRFWNAVREQKEKITLGEGCAWCGNKEPFGICRDCKSIRYVQWAAAISWITLLTHLHRYCSKECKIIDGLYHNDYCEFRTRILEVRKVCSVSGALGDDIYMLPMSQEEKGLLG